MITQNVFPVRVLPEPSRRQKQVHTNAESAYRARCQAEHTAGHEFADFLLRLSLEPSGRRAELRDTPSPFV